MTNTPGSDWGVTCSAAAVEPTNREDATLVLRLGLAVNALRAQMRFTRFSLEREPDAARWRDLNLALLQAAAYTREAISIMSGNGGRGERHVAPQSKRVHELAGRLSPSSSLEHAMRRLEGGSHPACSVITRVRNQLAFHWDPKSLDRFIREPRDDARLIWIEGTGLRTHEVTHRAAADALALAILDGRDETVLEEMIEAVMDAMKLVIDYFEAAVYSYIGLHNATFYGDVPRDALQGGTPPPPTLE